MDIYENGKESVDWTHLAQDTNRFQVHVKAIMNLLLP
jgi:hypothetical protein